MSNYLEYILNLKDQMSANLAKVQHGAVGAKNALTELSEKVHGFSLGGLTNILGAAGIGFGIFTFVQNVEQGIEKAHALHEAEAQLANTMQNMGTYSEEAFEKTVSGAKSMAKNILFSSAEVIGLQSQLRMVGNIGEDEMQRMTMASADMATKFKTSIEDAGNAIAKAVNNPEMLRRLGMQLKIDPAVQEHLQNLAKHGKEAQARMELLTIVEQKVGGAAKAAFDADPMARYNKQIGSLKMKLGEMAIAVQVAVMPFLVKLGEAVMSLFTAIQNGVGWVIDQVQKGNPWLIALSAILIGVIGSLILMQTWTLLVAAATAIWEGAQWLLNAALTANPVGIIIAGIITLIALIGYVVYKYKGWGDAWTALVNYLKFSFEAFKESFNYTWLNVVDAFMKGVEGMERAWFKFQSLWDEQGANEGLAKLDDKANARAKELAASAGKINEYNKMAAESLSKIKLVDTGKGIKDMIGDLKGKLGIAPAAQGGEKVKTNFHPTGLEGKDKSETVATGGTKNYNIHISIAKQIESLTVVSNNIKEGAEQIRDLILDEMSRALAMGEAVGQ
jgi:hypothetical protein